MPRKKKEESRKRSQKFDASFKNWMMQQAPVILPLLVPGVEYKQTMKTEIIRPVMAADVVFKVRYHGRKHILHVEFQTNYDRQLTSRLLVYNAVLH